MELITISRKRCREDQSIESNEYSEPDTKRRRFNESAQAEELLLLLESPVESPVEIVDQDLESVIRSFEEEIYTTTGSAKKVNDDPLEFLLEASADDVEFGDELQLGLGFEEEGKTSCYDLIGSLGVVDEDEAGEGIIVNYEEGGFARCDDVGDNFLLLGNEGKMNDFVSSSWPASLPAL